MLEDLETLGQRGGDSRKRDLPESWRPRLEVDSSGGYFVSTPRETPMGDVVDLLAEFDLDPAEWTVTNVRRSKWQRHDEEWLHSYRVSVVPVRQLSAALDPSELVDEIRKWRPSNEKPVKGDLTFLTAVGDTQWGKDAGDGSEGTARRVREGMESAKARLLELKSRGIGHVALPQMGDCIEGVVSQGGKIAGRLDLPLTSQIRVGRRVLLEWVKTFAPLTDDLVIPVVPGNHDESHRQLITDPMDSFQVDIVAQVMDIVGENPELSHVTARYAEPDNTTLTVNMSGVLVGMAHGHQARDIPKWWEGQALGQTPIGNADVLLTAHYHHFVAKNVGPRLWVQIPSMDGGSAWFRDRRGLDSPPGLVSMVVGEGYDSRKDIAVL